jgi:hypothetical protein
MHDFRFLLSEHGRSRDAHMEFVSVPRSEGTQGGGRDARVRRSPGGSLHDQRTEGVLPAPGRVLRPGGSADLDVLPALVSPDTSPREGSDRARSSRNLDSHERVHILRQNPRLQSLLHGSQFVRILGFVQYSDKRDLENHTDRH